MVMTSSILSLEEQQPKKKTQKKKQKQNTSQKRQTSKKLALVSNQEIVYCIKFDIETASGPDMLLLYAGSV